MADVSPSAVANKIPDRLYEVCLVNLVNYLQKSKCVRNDLRALPDHVLMDVYYKMLQEKRLCILGSELADLSKFERLLRYNWTQLRLLQCFQAVIEHGSSLPLELSKSFISRCDDGKLSDDDLLDLGLRLGGFLNEAGWYSDAQTVLLRCRDICQKQTQTTYYKRLTLECCHRLLNTQSSYCCFPAAADTFALSLRLLDVEDDTDETLPDSEAGRPSDSVFCRLESQCIEDDTRQGGPLGMRPLVARLCKEFSALFFVRCDYNRAYAWAMRAFKLLNEDTPPRIQIEVLGACGKACVVKRRFYRAGELVASAGARAAALYPPAHPRRARALLDRAFYLLNVDCITHSVQLYEEALSILRDTYGRSSLHVASAQEDLAYALYVLEYSSGRFYKARDHAERAIRIIQNLVPADHLLLASAKRVKALILEEIALDYPTGQDLSTDADEPSLLEQSEALHKAALKLSKNAFGENNVQTAKHYGNLGRLYQSMHKFQDAETMHLKAIAIKERLLGPDDYEVGLSIGHLASLYNYHMNMHCAAEKLYLRSIQISMKLFGACYSGLEYDYRGLVHVHAQLKQRTQATHYMHMLQRWHELREQSRQDPQSAALKDSQSISLTELQAKFFPPDD